MTYHGLAEKILRNSKTPLSANEIWNLAEQEGLVQELNSQGKTPSATLGARLYTIVKDCLLYTSPSPRDKRQSRMPSSA